MLKIDCLVAEIGSTTTTLNAFSFKKSPFFLGKGTSNTTVNDDVNRGLIQAYEDLKINLHNDVSYTYMFASSSAAGGLRMTVSGLVYEMTVRAAKEAALNAGANIEVVTAGLLEKDDLERIRLISPNIILVAGGTDYGDKDVAFSNIKAIANLELDVPIIYAGNIENHHRIKTYFSTSTQDNFLKIVENVYPRVDYLNILPVRKVIYQTFEEHIVHAKGMSKIRDMVDASIMPTPGSVMEATILLYEIIGNVMVIDVGGATTDVHSVSNPSDEYKKFLEGEAREKRTVEGDLGVFINYKNVLNTMDIDKLIKKLSIDYHQYNSLVQNYTYMPKTSIEKRLVFEITKTCVFRALDRHVGDMKKIYTSNGVKVIPEGKDLTMVTSIVLTGGPLIYLDDTEMIIKEYISQHPNKLLPPINTRIIKDRNYILSSVGVMSLKYPHEARAILIDSLEIKG